MTTHAYTVILHPNEPDEGPGFSVEVPALPGCFSCGDSLAHATAMAKEAILCHLEGMRIDNETLPVEVAPPEAPPGTTLVSITIREDELDLREPYRSLE